jgi:hypothetical protein
MNKNIHTKKQSGFALLFTVLIITLILTITVGISSTTFKQGVLSGLARDSQTAFYQADRLLECALQYHTKTPGGMYDNSMFTCGGLSYGRSFTPPDGILYYKSSNAGLIPPCAVLRVIPKNSTTLDNSASLQVSGYNICQAHPRQVERTLLVTF